MAKSLRYNNCYFNDSPAFNYCGEVMTMHSQHNLPTIDELEDAYRNIRPSPIMLNSGGVITTIAGRGWPRDWYEDDTDWPDIEDDWLLGDPRPPIKYRELEVNGKVKVNVDDQIVSVLDSSFEEETSFYDEEIDRLKKFLEDLTVSTALPELLAGADRCPACQHSMIKRHTFGDMFCVNTQCKECPEHHETEDSYEIHNRLVNEARFADFVGMSTITVIGMLLIFGFSQILANGAMPLFAAIAFGVVVTVFCLIFMQDFKQRARKGTFNAVYNSFHGSMTTRNSDYHVQKRYQNSQKHR